MASGPLLPLYRQRLQEADFHGARTLLDSLEQRHADVPAMAEIVAAERERLETCGLLLSPGRSSRDHLPTIRCPAPGIVRERRQQQHHWYFNAELESCLQQTWSRMSAEQASRGFRSLLVLGNNFSLSTGVFRPISHYLNFLLHHGGVRLRSVQLDDQAEPAMIDKLLEQHDRVLINGLQQICNVRHLADAVQRQTRRRSVYGYLHETRWILDRLPEDQKERVRRTLPHLDLMLCAQRQLEDFAPYGVPRSHRIICNPSLKPSLCRPEVQTRAQRQRGRVLMSGSIKERKGVHLFNACAERLHPMGIDFGWAGHIRDSSVPLSAVVTHYGHLGSEALQRTLHQTDVFFLSSLEDTFPLAAVEAYLHGCKLLLPRTTGLVDVLEGCSGVLIYEDHTVDCVAPLLLDLLEQPAPVESDRHRIAEELGLQRFIQRIHAPLLKQEDRERGTQEDWPSIAVIAHLYYTDLGFELSRHLQAVAGPQTDLYITIPQQKYSPDLEHRLRSMFATRFRQLLCIAVPDRGMDIGPFFSVIRHLTTGDQPPAEFILKIHTKKSLRVSGAGKGQRWRQGLLEGLLGNRDNVQCILNRFRQNPELGLLAPQPFLMQRSRRDQRVAANDDLVQRLLTLYQLPADPQRSFVRGSMFWVRSNALLPELATAPLPEAEAFMAGHARDGSLAHAYERLLSYLPQRHRPVHGHQPVCSDVPGAEPAS